MIRRSLALVTFFALGGAACEKHGVRHEGTSAAASSVTTTATSSSSTKDPKTAAVKCVADPHFPSPLKIPEASGAAEVELSPGVREILVVSDSGDHGAAIAWKIPDGPVRALTLPLDENAANDDLEGIAWQGGHLFTLTSSGAVRRFSPDGKGGLARDGAAYPLGDPPAACKDLQKVNCGRNYEGLCLRETNAQGVKPRCAGYAASKKEGALYCVVEQDNKLAIDTVRKPIVLAIDKDALSDCAFGTFGGPAQNTLVVTTNVHGGSASYVVDEATGALSTLDVGSTPSNEAITIDRDGTMYQFMDDNGDESLALKTTCTGW
ncbi:MAG TPA: hypothetical protein VF407_14465 [Polyangiaceae bacterium]